MGVTRGDSMGIQSQALDLDTGEPLKTFKWEDYVPWYMLQLEYSICIVREEGELQPREEMYKSNLQ